MRPRVSNHGHKRSSENSGDNAGAFCLFLAFAPEIGDGINPSLSSVRLPPAAAHRRVFCCREGARSLRAAPTLRLHRVRAFHCFPLFLPLIAIVIAIDPIVLALAGFPRSFNVLHCNCRRIPIVNFFRGPRQRERTKPKAAKGDQDIGEFASSDQPREVLRASRMSTRRIDRW